MELPETSKIALNAKLEKYDYLLNKVYYTYTRTDHFNVTDDYKYLDKTYYEHYIDIPKFKNGTNPITISYKCKDVCTIEQWLNSSK